MAMMSLVAFAAPRTGNIIKNCLSVFEWGENLLQNGLDSVNGQKSRWKVRF